MSLGFASNLTTFFVTFILLMAPCWANGIPRDRLLTLRNNAVPLDHQVRQLISQLGLRRRGCKAGAHYRRRLLAACSVTSSISQTSTAGEIPTINGHRFVNKDQLFPDRRNDCVTTCNVQSNGVQMSSAFIEHFERPTELSTSICPTSSYLAHRQSTLQPTACPPVSLSLSFLRKEVTHTGSQLTAAQAVTAAGRHTRQLCKCDRQTQRPALINCLNVTRTSPHVCHSAILKVHYLSLY